MLAWADTHRLINTGKGGNEGWGGGGGGGEGWSRYIGVKLKKKLKIKSVVYLRSYLLIYILLICSAFFVFVLILHTLYSLARNLDHLTWVRQVQQPREQRYPFILVCACIFVSVSRQWYMAASVLGFLTYAQMLMRAIAHEGCTDTVRGCALKVNSWRKVACCTGKPFFFFYNCRLLYRETGFFTTVACCTGKPFFFTTVACCTGKPGFLQLSLVVPGNRVFYNCRLLYRETGFFFYNCRLLYRETGFFTTAPIGRLWFI